MSAEPCPPYREGPPGVLACYGQVANFIGPAIRVFQANDAVAG